MSGFVIVKCLVLAGLIAVGNSRWSSWEWNNNWNWNPSQNGNDQGNNDNWNTNPSENSNNGGNKVTAGMQTNGGNKVTTRRMQTNGGQSSQQTNRPVTTKPKATGNAGSCDIRAKQSVEGILKRHNDYRRKFNSGVTTKNGGRFPAANPSIPDLKWSKDLEKLAQDWLHKSKCAFEHNPNRKASGFSSVGENLYYSTAIPCNCDENWNNAVDAWYEEIDLFPASSTCSESKKFTGNPSSVLHFTQIIWQKTTHLGCAITMCTEDDGSCKRVVVCNYGVGGNMVNEPIYTSSGSC